MSFILFFFFAVMDLKWIYGLNGVLKGLEFDLLKPAETDSILFCSIQSARVKLRVIVVKADFISAPSLQSSLPQLNVLPLCLPESLQGQLI